MESAHIAKEDTVKGDWFEPMELDIDQTDALESKASRHDPQNGLISKQPVEYGKPSGAASSLERSFPRSPRLPVRLAGVATRAYGSIQRVQTSVDQIDECRVLFPWTTSYAGVSWRVRRLRAIEEAWRHRIPPRDGETKCSLAFKTLQMAGTSGMRRPATVTKATGALDEQRGRESLWIEAPGGPDPAN
ncbi:MAG: hypothetical protein EOP14_03995 [Pseudomonas sp.]|nr:MAG: hypothetical protein EOP14_03995 [Pseudomonas sp.]